MKEKNLKIIFFIIIIALVIFAIYYIIKNQTTIVSEIKIKRTENQISHQIIMGITDFDTINPILSKNQDIQYISKLIYEPIINIGQDFKLEQGLGTEWSKLDEKTYIIRLDENKYWHNGEKFTAKDIEYTINYIKEQDTIYEDNVKNIKKIEIINDYIIKISLIIPEEDFEYMLCFPIICNVENIGTGDFVIESINGKNIVLKSKINENNLSINIYENSKKLYNAFSEEKIDIITSNNINFEKYIGKIGYNKKIICNRDFDYLKFNIEDQEVVHALFYAINKKEIVYMVYNNLYCTAEFPLQYGHYLYNGNIEHEYNISKAKQTLIDEGWEYKGEKWMKDGKDLNLEITTCEQRFSVAEIIKKNLEEVGIKVKIRKLSNSYYINNINRLNYEILLTGDTVSIKPSVLKYLNFEIEQRQDIEETYKGIYENYNKNPNFIGLYFDSILLLYSKQLKGNFECNWYNIFYNIDTWYKIKK